MERASLHYDEASWISKISMWWSLSITKYYKETKPSLSNLPEVPKSLEFEKEFDQLKENWNLELHKEKPSFLRALFRTVKKEYLLICALAVYSQIINVLMSLVIGFFIKWLKDDYEETYIGVLLLFIFAFGILSSFVALNRGLTKLLFLISKIKNYVVMLISAKVLKISYSTLQSENNSAKITNIIGTDIEVLEMMNISIFVWGSPIVVFVSIGLMYYYIGYAGLIGISIIILNVIVIAKLGKLTLKLRLASARLTDSRIKLTTNLIEGIKLVKLYGWEFAFLKLITKERAKEIFILFKLFFVIVVLKFLNFGLMPVSSFATMVTYIYSIGEITIEDAVSSFTILFVCNIAVSIVMTGGLRGIFLFIATSKRITETLLMNEISTEDDLKAEESGIFLQDVSFSWSPSSSSKPPVLTSLTFGLNPSELLIVAGPIGCGKTSLLTGLLKEIYTTQGSYKSLGSMSFSSDNPWIISESIRENVLMGQHFNNALYLESIENSQLLKDIEEMEAGENTIVGDRGVTLSGGQKARLGLARAYYSNKDFLLLDDPLSAVDSEVSSAIFKSIRAMAKKGKGVILVTHQIQFLPYADKIVILKEGSQVFFGTYQEMKMREDINEILGELMVNRKESGNEEANKKAEKEMAVKEGPQKKIEGQERIDDTVPLRVHWNYLKLGFNNYLYLLVILLVLIISQVMMLSVNFYVSFWAAADDQTDALYIYGFLVIIVGVYIFGFLRSGLIHLTLLRANKKLHDLSIESLAKTDSVFFDKNPSGRIITRYTKDTAIMDVNMMTYFTEAINVTLVLMGNIVLIIILSPGTLVGMCLYGIILYFSIKIILPVTKALRVIEITSRAPLLTSISYIVNGILPIRSMNLHHKFIENTQSSVIDNLRALITYYSVIKFLQSIIEFGSFLIGVANVTFLVIMKGNIDPELAAVTLSLTLAMNGLGSYWAKMIVETDNYMASPQRLFEYSDLEPEGIYTTDKDFKISQGKIEFQDVYMKYQAHLPYILKGLSFTILPRQKVGIIGRTGSGKSSILQVLFRLVNPVNGTVLIDDQDFIQAGLHQLRLQMSVIPQNSLIFRGTIRENLDPFSKFSDDEILTVLNKVNLKDFIDELPLKADTLISFDKISLSAGQKQLICLARSILSEAKIVMMDEATANVDHQTDKFIQNMIRKSFKQSTLLVIAHRLRTIIRSDLILVMEDGVCREMGSPYELAYNEGSLFHNFIQHSGSEEASYLFSKLHK